MRQLLEDEGQKSEDGGQKSEGRGRKSECLTTYNALFHRPFASLIQDAPVPSAGATGQAKDAKFFLITFADQCDRSAKTASPSGSFLHVRVNTA